MRGGGGENKLSRQLLTTQGLSVIFWYLVSRKKRGEKKPKKKLIKKTTTASLNLKNKKRIKKENVNNSEEAYIQKGIPINVKNPRKPKTSSPEREPWSVFHKPQDKNSQNINDALKTDRKYLLRQIHHKQHYFMYIHWHVNSKCSRIIRRWLFFRAMVFSFYTLLSIYSSLVLLIHLTSATVLIRWNAKSLHTRKTDWPTGKPWTSPFMLLAWARFS